MVSLTAALTLIFYIPLLLLSNCLTLLLTKYNSSIMMMNQNVLTYLNHALVISVNTFTSLRVSNSNRNRLR